MSPSHVNPAVVSAKSELVRAMLEGIESLPLASLQEFGADPHNAAAGESYLRRSPEALLDLGRHLLAKGFGVAAVEYKEIPTRLHERRVLSAEERVLIGEMAGYRNRMVHLYDQIGVEELFGILSEHRQDIATILDALVSWVRGQVGSLEGSI